MQISAQRQLLMQAQQSDNNPSICKLGLSEKKNLGKNTRTQAMSKCHQGVKFIPGTYEEIFKRQKNVA